MAGVNDAYSSAFSMLGDVFLKNAVVVADVWASQLRVRKRSFYCLGLI